MNIGRNWLMILSSSSYQPHIIAVTIQQHIFQLPFSRRRLFFLMGCISYSSSGRYKWFCCWWGDSIFGGDGSNRFSTIKLWLCCCRGIDWLRRFGLLPVWTLSSSSMAYLLHSTGVLHGSSSKLKSLGWSRRARGSNDWALIAVK